MMQKIELPGIRSLFRSALLAAAAFLVLLPAGALGGLDSTHLDKAKNPYGCAGCHKGHGKSGTAMLDAANNEICFTCHGFSIGPGKVRTKTDLQSVFQKRSKHPVLETSQYHKPDEQLPENSSSIQRHVACQDCHRVHALSPSKPMAGVRGYARGVVRDIGTGDEFMLCYKCHSDSANLPYNSTNVGQEFDVSNQSYHPVEAPGRNTIMPSLKGQLNVNSTIKCTDCHGNDDKFGPRGPHGSNYDFILKAQYLRTETTESASTYELCYSCHDRQSILDNASFQKHREHVVFNRVPCSACHNPHGSRNNPNLIEFDTAFVGASELASYASGAGGKPVCFLKCHIGGIDTEHNSAFYKAKKWP